MLNILMVDDEEDLGLLITQRFRKNIISKEYSFIFGNNGKDALDKISVDSKVDLIITDLNMPKMNGLELLIQVKKYHQGIDVIIMSAYSDSSAVRSTIAAGAADFIFKPLDFKSFEKILQRYANSKANNP